MTRICNICHRAIPAGQASINGRHYQCHVNWCADYDARHLNDPEFVQEYWGDDA